MAQEQDSKPAASFMYSMKAVFWSFFGLRRKSDFDTDSARLNPLHVVIAALLGAAIFIALLIAVVSLVVSQ